MSKKTEQPIQEPVQSTKTISMSFMEYNKELMLAESKGMGYVAQLVRDIIRHDGKNITNMSQVKNDLTEFLDEVRTAMKRSGKSS